MILNTVVLSNTKKSDQGYQYLWINWVLLGTALVFKVSSLTRTIVLLARILDEYKALHVSSIKAALYIFVLSFIN